MKTLKDYTIKFSGLKLGKHSFDFQLDDRFFEHFGYSDFEKPRICAEVEMMKKENGLDLKMKIKGLVEVPCDLTNEPFDMPVEGEMDLVVKYGEEFDDSNEDILILPHGEHQVDLGQYLYETTVLSMPLKRLSPEARSGEKGKEVLNKLEGLQGDSENETDPRWDKLKDLLN